MIQRRFWRRLDSPACHRSPRPRQEYKAAQFDARAAKLLRPGQHLVVGGCPGLRLEVTPSTKTWTYRYKSPLDGRMKQAALGQWPRMGIMEAAQAWQEKRQQRGDGVEPGTLTPAGAKLERWLPGGAWNRARCIPAGSQHHAPGCLRLAGGAQRLRRVASGLETKAFQRAIETWWPYWKAMCGN